MEDKNMDDNKNIVTQLSTFLAQVIILILFLIKHYGAIRKEVRGGFECLEERSRTRHSEAVASTVHSFSELRQVYRGTINELQYKVCENCSSRKTDNEKEKGNSRSSYGHIGELEKEPTIMRPHK